MTLSKELTVRKKIIHGVGIALCSKLRAISAQITLQGSRYPTDRRSESHPGDMIDHMGTG